MPFVHHALLLRYSSLSKMHPSDDWRLGLQRGFSYPRGAPARPCTEARSGESIRDGKLPLNIYTVVGEAQAVPVSLHLGIGCPGGRLLLIRLEYVVYITEHHEMPLSRSCVGKGTLEKPARRVFSRRHFVPHADAEVADLCFSPGKA